MIERGLVDFVATDAHGVHNRPPVLSKAYREVVRQFDVQTARRLFYENPQKILNSIPE
jgi:tyrosine-protein phosphatase YwqE